MFSKCIFISLKAYYNAVLAGSTYQICGLVLCRCRPWAHTTYILQSHLQFASCQISVSFIIPATVSEYFYEPRHFFFFFYHQEKEPGNIPKATFSFSKTEVSQNADKGALDVSKMHMFPWYSSSTINWLGNKNEKPDASKKTFKKIYLLAKDIFQKNSY